MIACLLINNIDHNLNPVLEKSDPVSFLPITITSNLLSYTYSWINSFFSKDKIYVVCMESEKELVISSCKEICEENIIIEPIRINYSISVFYSNLVIGKILIDENILFYPVNFLFNQDFKVGNLFFSLNEIAEKDWVIIPSILINKDEKRDCLIDAGKILKNEHGFDYFIVDEIGKIDNKRKKLFGKISSPVKIIFGKQKSILSSFLSDESIIPFIKKLNDCFFENEIEWESITAEYNKIDKSSIYYDYFTGNKNFLTIFLDTKQYYLDNWKAFKDRFFQRDGVNYISGNVNVTACKKVICFNYIDTPFSISNLSNAVAINNEKGVQISCIDY